MSVPGCLVEQLQEFLPKLNHAAFACWIAKEQSRQEQGEKLPNRQAAEVYEIIAEVRPEAQIGNHSFKSAELLLDSVIRGSIL